LKKIITYIVIVIAAGYLIRTLFYFGLTQNKFGVFDKFNSIFEKRNNFETVILGSSRAESHFDCRIIDSALHTNSFNLGIEGASLPFALDVFGAYLEKSEFPKNIILNIDYHINKCDNDTVFMFPRYFPYLNNNKLYNALKSRDGRFISFRYIPFYSLPYMGDKYLAASMRGYLGKPGQYDLKSFKGYIPVLPINYIPPSKWKFPSYDACDGGIMYDRLDSLITLCKKKNARLFLVLSPMYVKGTEQIKNKSQLIDKIKTKALLNHLAFLDYSSDSLCNYPEYFADPFHMNERGSELFSSKLVDQLQPFFK
jgi:hypothetical protein